MTVTSNYLILQQRIADELGDRTDLMAPLSDSALVQSPIQNAIQSAIARWERRTFYFNELIVIANSSSPWKTVLGQEYYGAADYAGIATIASLRRVWVIVSNQRYTLNRRTPQYLDDTSVNPSTTSQPVDYAYAAEQMRLYPIPDNSYPMGLEGTSRLTPLVNNTDENAWTDDAEGLIRSTAKMILAIDTLHDQELATECAVAIYGAPGSPYMGSPKTTGYLYDLDAETTRRRASNRIRPTHF